MLFVLVRNIDNAMQCKKLCKIARALNSTAISKYVTLKMTDVPSNCVWTIKESCYVYTTISIVAAIQTKWNYYVRINLKMSVAIQSKREELSIAFPGVIINSLSL